MTGKVATAIRNIQTDFYDEFTAKVQTIFSRHSTILELREELPPNRPGFDHEINLVLDAKSCSNVKPMAPFDFVSIAED